MATMFARKNTRFGTKNAGHGMAKKRWVCANCLHMHEEKHIECIDCTMGEIIYCDSEKEAKRYQVLRRREDQGRIFGLIPHPAFRFEMKNYKGKTVTPLKYVADFFYFNDRSQYQEMLGLREQDPVAYLRAGIVEDVKPKSKLAWTDTFKIKHRLMREVFGIDIVIVTKEGQ